MAETIDLEFKADISNVKDQLKRMVKETGDASANSVKELAKQLGTLEAKAKRVERAEKKAAKAAKKLSDEAADTGKRGKAGLEALKQAAEAMGGSVGASAGVIEKLGRSVSEFAVAAGPAGGLAIASAVGIAAVAASSALAGAAVAKLVFAADDWLAALKEVDAADNLVSEEDARNIIFANDALANLGDAARRVGVILAAEFAPGVEESLLSITGFVKGLESTAASAGKVVDVFNRAQEIGSFVDSWTPDTPTEVAWNYLTDAMWGSVEAGEAVTRSADGLTRAEKASAKAATETKTKDEAATIAKDAKAEATKKAADAARAASDATRTAARETEEHTKALARNVAQLIALQDSEDAAAAATDRLDMSQQGAATLAALDMGKASRDSQLEGLDRINQKYDDQLIKLKDLENQGASMASVRDASHAIGIARLGELEKFKDDSALAEVDRSRASAALVEQGMAQKLSAALTFSSAALDTIDILSGKRLEGIRAGVEAEREAAFGVAEAWADTERSRIEARLASGAISEKEATLALADIEKQKNIKLAAAQNIGKEEERAAKKSFRARQAAAVGQAIIGAALNAVMLIPSFLFMGPGAPIGASAAAAASLVPQLAAISQQEPPSFASGGMVGDRMQGDHGTISASRSEGIVSPRGMAALGREGLDSLNAGQGQQTSLSVMIDSKVIASTVIDALTNDSRVGNTLAALTGVPAGRALVYGRG